MPAGNIRARESGSPSARRSSSTTAGESGSSRHRTSARLSFSPFSTRRRSRWRQHRRTLMSTKSTPEPIIILLVEDNPADARLTAEGLKRAKVLNQLHIVEDGEEAVAFLRREGQWSAAPRPDIVFLDLNLPKMDGREVLSIVKGDPALEHIPIVVLTSSDADVDILKAYKAKANCYVKKPVMFQEFLNTIKLIDDFWLSVVKLPREAA